MVPNNESGPTPQSPAPSTWRHSDNPRESSLVALSWVILPIIVGAAVSFVLSGAG